MSKSIKELWDTEVNPSIALAALRLLEPEYLAAKAELHRVCEVDWVPFLKDHSSMPLATTRRCTVGDFSNWAFRRPGGSYSGVSERDTEERSGFGSFFEASHSNLDYGNSPLHRLTATNVSQFPLRYLYCHNLRKALKFQLCGGEEEGEEVATNLAGPEKYRKAARDSFDQYNGPRAQSAQGMSYASFSATTKKVVEFAIYNAYVSSSAIPVTASYVRDVVDNRIISADIGGKWRGTTISAKKIEEHSSVEDGVELFEALMVHGEQRMVVTPTTNRNYLSRCSIALKAEEQSLVGSVSTDRSSRLVITQEERDISSPLGEIDNPDFSESCLEFTMTTSHEDHRSKSLTISYEEEGLDLELVENYKVFQTKMGPGLFSKANHRITKRTVAVVDTRYIAKWTSDSDEVVTCTGTTPNRALSVMKRRTRTAILDALDF